jgi:hypothetical protein
MEWLLPRIVSELPFATVFVKLASFKIMSLSKEIMNSLLLAPSIVLKAEIYSSADATGMVVASAKADWPTKTDVVIADIAKTIPFFIKPPLALTYL